MSQGQSRNHSRNHSMDALRALLLLLGIVLHASLAYMVNCPVYWFIKDPQRHFFFDASFFVIHAFRLEAFFLIAGFFAAPLYQQGLRVFLANRGRRLLLPFLLTLPLMKILVPWAAGGQLAPWLLQLVEPYHLWFIYYLLWIYLLGIFIKEKISVNFKRCFKIILSAGLDYRLGFLGLASLTGPSLLLSPTLYLSPPYGYFPFMPLLVYYSIFFTVGWLLCLELKHSDSLVENRYFYLVAGLGFSSILLLVFYRSPQIFSLPWQLQLVLRYLYACNSWLLVFSLLGFGFSNLNFYHAGCRYVAQASYWLYLVHYPLIIYLQRLLQPLALPLLIKLVFEVVVTLVIGLLTYQLLLIFIRRLQALLVYDDSSLFYFNNR